jgi:hypothetical protein
VLGTRGRSVFGGVDTYMKLKLKGAWESCWMWDVLCFKGRRALPRLSIGGLRVRERISLRAGGSSWGLAVRGREPCAFEVSARLLGMPWTSWVGRWGAGMG